MKSLEEMRVQCARIEAAMKSMDEGLAKLRASLSTNEKWIAVAESGGEIDYELPALKAECIQIKANLAVVENARQMEQDKLTRVAMDVAAGISILKAHGKCPALMLDGKHNWEIVSVFDAPIALVGQWNHRKCKECPTEERLGHN